MRVAQVTSMHPWNDDRIFERNCIALFDLGIDVSLIATGDGNYSYNSKISFWELKERKGIIRRVFSSIEATVKAWKGKFDIIHFHDPDLLPWMFALSLFSRKTIIYDIHENYLSRFENLPTPLNKFMMSVYAFLEKICIRGISGITVVSESMRKNYSYVKDKQVFILPNVPYLRKLNTELPDDPPEKKFKNITIISSGTNSPARNCIQLVEAFAKVLGKHPGLKLMFVGRYYPDGYDEKLKAKAKMLGIESHVLIEGMLPWIENFTRVRSAHIGCVFYADNLNNRVGIPNRIFEYMYSGLAIIGENFPEVKSIIEDSQAGETIDSSDPDSIAEGIMKIIQDKKRLLDLGKNAQLAVKEKYNFDILVPKIVKFYKTLT